MIKKKDQRNRSHDGTRSNFKTVETSERNFTGSSEKTVHDSLQKLADDYLAIMENSISSTVVIEAASVKILFANKTELTIFSYGSMGDLGKANLWAGGVYLP